jgi:hypothetical protein
LLLAEADAFPGVVTGAGDPVDFWQGALSRDRHTRPGGRIQHLTTEALGYRFGRARRWDGEDGDCGRCCDRDRESTGKD